MPHIETLKARSMVDLLPEDANHEWDIRHMPEGKIILWSYQYAQVSENKIRKYGNYILLSGSN